MALLGTRISNLVAWLVAGLCVCAPLLRAEQVAEHDVKAAYLYNFTRFVEWPADVPPLNQPFRLCVVADATTTEAVKRTMTGESVGGRATETLVPDSSKEIRKCQILFIGRSATHRAEPLLHAAKGLPILVVGETPGFAKNGAGTIEFIREDNRVRFEVNVEAAKRCGLSISSRLLQVAKQIYGARP
jgi:hypothetical protein